MGRDDMERCIRVRIGHFQNGVLELYGMHWKHDYWRCCKENMGPFRKRTYFGDGDGIYSNPDALWEKLSFIVRRDDMERYIVKVWGFFCEWIKISRGPLWERLRFIVWKDDIEVSFEKSQSEMDFSHNVPFCITCSHNVLLHIVFFHKGGLSM